MKTKRDLEKLVDEINAGRPQCPVGLNTLVIPRKVTLGEHVNQPYVYLNCGHVQGEFVLAHFKTPQSCLDGKARARPTKLKEDYF